MLHEGASTWRWIHLQGRAVQKRPVEHLDVWPARGLHRMQRHVELGSKCAPPDSAVRLRPFRRHPVAVPREAGAGVQRVWGRPGTHPAVQVPMYQILLLEGRKNIGDSIW
eukprot:6203050-Pleurochrysis_carterae.AAC.1